MRQSRHTTQADLKTLRLLFAGLAAGDSLGSATEFMHLDQVPACYRHLREQGWPFRQAGSPSRGLASGSPTDDTEMALCMIRSYFREGGFDPQGIAREFVSWMRGGPRDIGGTTRRTLQICAEGGRFWEGGLSFWREVPHYAANGSLMRNGIAAGLAGLTGSSSLERAFDYTLKHGMITHYAPLPQICCLAHTYLITELLQGRGFEDQWLSGFLGAVEGYLGGTDDGAVLGWLGQVGEDGEFEKAMSLFCREIGEMSGSRNCMASNSPGGFDPFRVDYTGGSGYCLLTLKIALWALCWSLEDDAYSVPPGFPDEVFAAKGSARLAWVAMIGHDADTYSAVAGPLISAAAGGLPPGFTEGLAALQEFDQITGQAETGRPAKNRVDARRSPKRS